MAIFLAGCASPSAPSQAAAEPTPTTPTPTTLGVDAATGKLFVAGVTAGTVRIIDAPA